MVLRFVQVNIYIYIFRGEVSLHSGALTLPKNTDTSRAERWGNINYRAVEEEINAPGGDEVIARRRRRRRGDARGRSVEARSDSIGRSNLGILAGSELRDKIYHSGDIRVHTRTYIHAMCG